MHLSGMRFAAGKRWVVVAAALCVASLALVQGPASEAESQTREGSTGEEFARGQLIVKLEGQAEQADLREINRENDATTEENLPASDVNVVDLPSGLTVSEADEIYEDSPDVEYAEPDYKLEPSATPNDQYFGRLWGLDNTGQTGGTPDADIDAPEAWNTTTGTSATVVAVIDEGVDVNHPDLRDNVWVNRDEVPGNRIDDDDNGYVDDVNGYDFAGDDASVYDPDPVTGDGDEHGTHVAGTIAASGNNAVGVTGVNWDARVMSLKFLGENGGFTSDAVEALNYAVDNGVKISNNSWGGGGYSQALRDAIAEADASGHLFVAAAGNGGADGVGDNNDTTPNYPSNYGVPNVIAVAASNDRDTLGSFSNFGANSVDLAAPGVNILSTLPANSYGSYSGTSMASPHVAGVAALLKSQNPALDDAQIKNRILSSVDKKASLEGKVLTGGRLNADAALVAGGDPAPEPDTTDPTITNLRPVPGSSTTDRTATIRATVQDETTDLTASDIRLYVNGDRKTSFSYNRDTNNVSFTTGALPYDSHTARVGATDDAGNARAKQWNFRVVR